MSYNLKEYCNLFFYIAVETIFERAMIVEQITKLEEAGPFHAKLINILGVIGIVNEA